MGYVARTVTAENVVKALAETVPLYQVHGFMCTTSYQVIYKKTIDLTDVDNLWYSVYNASGNNAVILIELGAATLLEDTCPTVDTTTTETDITGYTGDTVVKVSIKTVGAAKRLDGIAVWGSAD